MASHKLVIATLLRNAKITFRTGKEVTAMTITDPSTMFIFKNTLCDAALTRHSQTPFTQVKAYGRSTLFEALLLLWTAMGMTPPSGVTHSAPLNIKLSNSSGTES